MYKIVRSYFRGGSQSRDPRPTRRTIKTGLTLEQAQEHCRNPETSSSTAISAKMKRYTAAHGAWFDGYEET